MRDELDARKTDEQLRVPNLGALVCLCVCVCRGVLSRDVEIWVCMQLATSRTKHRDIEREWKQRVEELKTGLTTARDTIQAQKIQMAKLMLGLGESYCASVADPSHPLLLRKASEKSDANSDLHEAIAHWKTQLSQANTKLEERFCKLTRTPEFRYTSSDC